MLLSICMLYDYYYVCQVLSLAMDGADQSAHDLPKVLGRVPKDLSAWPQKLQCVVAHGAALCMFNMLNVVRAGANMALTCLMRTLQILDQTIQHTAISIITTLYLQVDGGSENWNVLLFAVIDLLFDLYPNLQTVIVSRLPVGHTHIDIDRFFSYLNQKLFGTASAGRSKGADVLTREDFQSLFASAMSSNKDTMLLDHHLEDMNAVYDWWSFLSPHLFKGFTGYGSSGNVHVFRYQRRGQGPPHVSYKYWHQSTEWLPAGGESLKILETRPDLRDLKAMQVEAHIDDAQEVLIKLQKPVLKWLQEQAGLGLIGDDKVASWKSYFKTLGHQIFMHMQTCTYTYTYAYVHHIRYMVIPSCVLI